jgi:DNA-binding protein H-NS
MAEEPQAVCEWLDIELDKLTSEDKLNLISGICNTLTVQDLMRVQDIAGVKRQEKLEDAKQQVIEEMKEKFEQLGLSFDEVMGVYSGRSGRRTRVSQLPPKYISPKGETWSGRGYPPQWIRDLEEEGQDREDYLIKEEG